MKVRTYEIALSSDVPQGANNVHTIDMGRTIEVPKESIIDSVTLTADRKGLALVCRVPDSATRRWETRTILLCHVHSDDYAPNSQVHSNDRFLGIVCDIDISDLRGPNNSPADFAVYEERP